MTNPSNLSNNNRIATWVAVIVTVAWAVSFVVDILVKDYDPSASVHALMMMVAGAVFGEGLIKTRSGNGKSAPQNKEGET